ncbi:MAG: hypothetical protein HY300_09120 [Verrucomicrobia bacterium]|nr:hypothetical protein [Verrucomicrobiota bacterium]
MSLALGACSKKEPPQTASPPAKPAVSVDSLVKSDSGTQPADAPPAPAAPAPAPGTPAPVSSSAPEPGGPEATDAAIAAYNQALSRWIGMHEDAPVDLNALKKVKGLPPLPTPPSGRQIIYVINPKSPIMSHVEVR